MKLRATTRIYTWRPFRWRVQQRSAGFKLPQSDTVRHFDEVSSSGFGSERVLSLAPPQPAAGRPRQSVWFFCSTSEGRARWLPRSTSRPPGGFWEGFNRTFGGFQKVRTHISRPKIPVDYPKNTRTDLISSFMIVKKRILPRNEMSQ